jgi:hypothetical protein
MMTFIKGVGMNRQVAAVDKLFEIVFNGQANEYYGYTRPNSTTQTIFTEHFCIDFWGAKLQTRQPFGNVRLWYDAFKRYSFQLRTDRIIDINPYELERLFDAFDNKKGLTPVVSIATRYVDIKLLFHILNALDMREVRINIDCEAFPDVYIYRYKFAGFGRAHIRPLEANDSYIVLKEYDYYEDDYLEEED